MKLYISFFSFLIVSTSILAQPFIMNETVEKIYFDDFTDESQNWPTLSEPTVKAIVIQGYYYMERPGSTKSRAIIPSYPSIGNKFMIKTAIMLGPATNEAQTLGILFMTQLDGSGGYVFEINRKQQFRIRGVVSAGQYITTGDAGWVKSKHLVDNDYNKIVIKGFGGKYDVFINDQHNFSFQNNSFKDGDFGLVIGPEAKGKVDYFYVYKLNANMPEVEEKEQISAAIDSLKKENDSLKTELKIHFNSTLKDADVAIKVLVQQLEVANKEIAELKKKPATSNGDACQQLQLKIDSLEQENQRKDKTIETLKSATKYLESQLENKPAETPPANKEMDKKE